MRHGRAFCQAGARMDGPVHCKLCVVGWWMCVREVLPLVDGRAGQVAEMRVHPVDKASRARSVRRLWYPVPTLIQRGRDWHCPGCDSSARVGRACQADASGQGRADALVQSRLQDREAAGPFEDRGARHGPSKQSPSVGLEVSRSRATVTAPAPAASTCAGRCGKVLTLCSVHDYRN